MSKVTVRFDSDLEAKRLINVLKRNRKEDREKYNITIIKKEASPNQITTPTGEKIRLKTEESQKYEKANSYQRQKAVTEFIFFKAQGTFQGSKPKPNSPYQTAGPFFSNTILGEVIFPGHQNINKLHKKLSNDLNDTHIHTGLIGDWRETHSKKYGGYWSYRLEKFVRIHFKGTKPRNVIIYSTYKES